jgi:hypothetical protein
MSDKPYCSCQHCRFQSLGCDRARPSCWNCQQNYQQCSYKHDKISIVQTEDYQPVGIHAELISECIPWLDSLRDHPYHSLEGDRKLGFVGTWCLKSRHGHSSKNVSLNRQNIDIKKTEEDSMLTPLGRHSPTLSEDEAFPIVPDTADDTTSLMGSSTSTLVHSYSHKGVSYSALRTVPLNFGVESRSSVSTNPLPPRRESTPSSSSSDSRVSESQERSCRVMQFSESSTQLRAGSYSDASPTSFQCVFCLETCGNQEEWEQHETSQHITQRDWICMPWGPIEQTEDGKDICVFCSAVDPGISHCSQHRDEPCIGQAVEDRTYTSKQDFQKHLFSAHNQPALTKCMNKWSFAPKDDAWYWHCGFCDTLLARWTDRVTHIGDHFKEGMLMSSWDPLMPPYPLDKTTGTCATWFPPLSWDAETLLALQLEQCNRADR